MHINICRGGDRTVSQPGLNIFQADTVGEKQAGTAMPEIVKTNAAHIMLFQELRELGTEKVRPHQFSKLIDIDVIQILGTVAVTAEPAVHCLFFFDPQQQFLKGCHQR